MVQASKARFSVPVFTFSLPDDYFLAAVAAATALPDRYSRVYQRRSSEAIDPGITPDLYGK
jgi:hypothetical protein